MGRVVEVRERVSWKRVRSELRGASRQWLVIR